MDYTFVCGSAGREGVAVQIGATLSHYMGRKLKTPDNSRIMLITGMAAGFGGLFQTPLAATFFAMEVIVAGYHGLSGIAPGNNGSFCGILYITLFGTGKVCSRIK